jgi:predicted PurR-regulated permease PerM
VQAEELKLPFYVKVTIFLVGLVAFLTIIYLAKSLFIPLVFATIIAIVLHPVVNFMVRIKINRILAIILTMFLTFLVIAAFGAILISQAGKFGESWFRNLQHCLTRILQMLPIILIKTLRRSMTG